MIQAREIDGLDLRRHIRPGDTIWCGQACAEPLGLTQALVRQRQEIGGCNLFCGLLASQTFQPDHADHITFLSYGALGNGRRLADAGVLDVLPSHYSQLPVLIDRGTIRADVVLIQLSAEGPDGTFSLGLCHDYLVTAARRARVVIAEVNDQVPWTYGSEELAGIRIDEVVRSSYPPPRATSAATGETERRIAAGVADYVGDKATLEVGIGMLGDAILSALADRRDLGIHTGLLGDGALDLIERGVVTNGSKSIDPGVTIAGMAFGTERLSRHAQANPQFKLAGPAYTHGIATLARIDGFVAINSAIEVDLTGQVNAEVLDGLYVGAIGGQVDFIRGARESRGGRSIIALPSTTRNGKRSRIVHRLADGITTTARADADVFVTEWGSAELRGQPLQERRRRMIGIAHPAHREALERQVRGEGS